VLQPAQIGVEIFGPGSVGVGAEILLPERSFAQCPLISARQHAVSVMADVSKLAAGLQGYALDAAARIKRISI